MNMNKCMKMKDKNNKQIAAMAAAFLLFLFMAGCGGGAHNDPFVTSVAGSFSPERGAVSNVRITGSGGSVAVTYDLNGADTCSVRLFYSLDGGASYAESLALSGDTAEVAPGSDRKIIWNGAAGLDLKSGDVRVRISARGLAGSEAYADSVGFTTKIPASTAASSKIVFHSERDVNKQIYVMNADGSNLCKLSSGNSSDFNPGFSPDGSKILFLSNSGGLTNELFIMNSDGGALKKLSSLDCDSAAFAPDGNSVIYSGYGRGELYPSLYSVSVDGTGLRYLTNYDKRILYIKSLTYSPDGSKISFYNSSEIYTGDANGGEASLIFKNSGVYIKSLCYSPDGKKLMFVSYGVIYTINADGTGVAPLSAAMYADAAYYSPDGKSVIFTSKYPVSSSIFILDLISGEVSSPQYYMSTADFSPSMAPGFVMGVIVPKILQEIKIGYFEAGWPVFDLRKIDCKAIYSDGTSFSVSPRWSLVSGDGTVADGVFTASANASRAVIGAEYSEGGVTKRAEIILNNASGDISGKIYFASKKNSANTEIFSVYPDGQGVTKVIGNHLSWAADPAVSPDGKMIAYTAMVDGNSELFIDYPETGRRTRITKNSYNDQDPNFSPDGKYLAYTTWKDGNSNIYKMQLPSSTDSYAYEYTSGFSSNLDNNSDFDFMPTYHPGGKFVIFNSYRGGKFEIFLCQDYYLKHTWKLFGGTPAYDDMYPKFSPDGKDFIFSSNRSGKYNLYKASIEVPAQFYAYDSTAAPVVGAAERLTDGAFNDTFPAYSPDGSKIAFISDRSGREEIYVADASSLADPVKLTQGAILKENDFVCWVCFSSDGKSLLFASGSASKQFEIYSVSLDAKTLKKIVRCACNYVNPAISKDGLTIAYDSDEFSTGTFAANNFESLEHREYRTVHANFYDLSIRKLLRPVSAKTSSPFFSTLNFGKIVYSAFDDGVFGIKSFSSGSFPSTASVVEDSSYTYMTNVYFDNYTPCYSPDDKLVAFASPRDGAMQVYTMDASGNFQKKLTSAGSNREPKFSPDGKKIVFTSTRDGNDEIYIMDIDGGNQTRLTSNLYDDNMPCFSPGGKVLFCASPFGGPELHLMEADGRAEIVFYKDYALSPIWK